MADVGALRRWAEQDYLFGDWRGLRTDLSAHGIDFEFAYFAALPSNLEGGLRRGSVYEGALLMTADLRSERLLGYGGGRLHAGGLNIHNGRGFSTDYVGDLNRTSLLDFPDMFRLWELWYEQTLCEGKLSLKLGQLDIGRDFIVPEYYSSLTEITFLNQTFFFPTLAFNVNDIPGLPAGNHGLASTPYGAPGALVRFEPLETLYLQVGAYDGFPDQGRAGTSIQLQSDEGALIYFETGIRLGEGSADDGLEGRVKLGGYYHTDEFVDVDRATRAAFEVYSARVPEHSGNFGLYLLGEHELYREGREDGPAEQGLVGFIRVEGAPADRNLAEFGVGGGLVYRGPIRGRDWDRIGIAASYLRISDDIGAAFSKAKLPRPDYEAVVEIAYRLQLTTWWVVQPSLQYVVHPGGGTNPVTLPDDALNIIVQMVFRL